ncbi:MAG: M20/M25/M40 family metallo-hydrolase [Alphaproteobacteria bacterium]|nr:M20/M25/M40 family metallo-hydrolase [Alphaproteobacteria bacterium]
MNKLSFLIVGLSLFLTMLSISLTAQETSAPRTENPRDPSIRMIRYAETPYALKNKHRGVDPAIAAMVNAVNPDTLRARLQELQDWGSRFVMEAHNRDVAVSLLNRFRSYGYTDVKLDSFFLVLNNWYGVTDSAWQYNVICTLTGTSAPDEVYVIGGHYDSYSSQFSNHIAPGVDDNGSAVAATLEIARIMKQAGYQPQTTLQFTLFGAEEVGLKGSKVAAERAKAAGIDIRYMLNMDMIANNPENLPEVAVYHYLGFEWAGMCAASATERYTDLTVMIPENMKASGSDSYSYWMQNFPVAYFEEFDFSPHWHKISDTLGNCNTGYLAKVTGAALATIAEQQSIPFPQDLTATSTTDDVVLQWKPTQNTLIRGVNIYRSDTSGHGYQKINQEPVAGSTFHDVNTTLYRPFFYVITTVTQSLQESDFSNEVSGTRFGFTDTLLVIANLKGSKTTHDSIRAYYEAVLDTIPFVWYDNNADQIIGLSEVSRYRNIFWMTNYFEYEPMNATTAFATGQHASNGGNILFTGFNPVRFWVSPTASYPYIVPENHLFREIFGIDSCDRKIQSMMFRANSVVAGYDTLHIDSLKFFDPTYPGELFNVEVFAPDSGGTVIYRFDTRYPPDDIRGKMKNRPVGLSNMGSIHKGVLLSFPLWYVDTTDAKNFIHHVITELFTHPTGIPNQEPTVAGLLQIFPNPVNDICNLQFTLNQPGRARLTLVSTSGSIVKTIADGAFGKGIHRLSFPVNTLAPGIYYIRVQTEAKTFTGKVICQP